MMPSGNYWVNTAMLLFWYGSDTMNMTLRMAIDLYNDLKKIALEEERSINGEICYILKKYIEEYKKAKENSK